VKDFGTSPYYGPTSRIRVELRCYWYEKVLVKEYDAGQKGADWHAVVLMTNRVKPTCAQSHLSGERVIDGTEWSGYFKGVKGDLVFLQSADGTNGGMAFVVYDAQSGKKIFEDSAYADVLRDRKLARSLRALHFDHMRVRRENDQIYLTYLRVVEADCDLDGDKSACWDQVRSKFKVEESRPPGCLRYEGISHPRESGFAYPVEV